MSVTEMHDTPSRDPYRGVIIVLLAASALGTVAAYTTGLELANPVVIDTSVTLGLSTGILIGIALAQNARARPLKIPSEPSSTEPAEKPDAPPPADIRPSADILPMDDGTAATRLTEISVWIQRCRVWIRHRFGNLQGTEIAALSTAAAGILAILRVLLLEFPTYFAPSPIMPGITAVVCLGAAGLAATAARYFGDIDLARLPEGPALRRGARVVAWILVLAAVSIGLAWVEQQTVVTILHWVLLTVNVAVCYGLITVSRIRDENLQSFPLDLGVLSMLGSRANVVASILDNVESQLGIDLRSTWALTVVRQSVEPLLIGLCLIGWLSTSLTVVEPEEQGLLERFGVPANGPPLVAGLHLHLPWPIDRVSRIPVQRVQSLAVGHEGEQDEQQAGPENVLWARQHAAQEYTLLLGNGRDLITVDAAVQFRIADARAWRYNSQNPGAALRAIAYRAVMKSTVNLTLSEALSENVAELTGRMRAMVQRDADALGLGVDVMAFTVGGMHPPVDVASDYEAVVSAELGKVTAVVSAQAYRNQMVPSAEASVVTGANGARAEGAETLAKAAGEAWSFRALQSQYRTAPEEYLFRRRLETLEKGLGTRRFTVVDSRFQRDGGELWLIP